MNCPLDLRSVTKQPSYTPLAIRSLRLCLLVAIIGGILAYDASAAPNEETDDVRTIARLIEIWKGFDSDIITARLTCRRIATAPGQEINRETVRRSFEDVDFIARPDDARKVSDRLHLGLSPDRGAWGYLKLSFAPGTSRQDTSFDGKNYRSMVVDQPADTQIDARWTDSQISMRTRQQSRVRGVSLAQLRFVPKGIVADGGTVVSRDGEVVTLEFRDENGPLQVIAHEPSGLVTNFMQGDPEKRAMEGIFLDPVEYAGHVIFPSVSIIARYVRNNLASIEINVIEEASFNSEISDETFAVPAAAGTRIFDHRTDEREPKFTEVQQPIEDVRTMPQRTAPLDLAAHEPVYKRALFWASVVLVIAALVGILIRQIRRVNPTHSL